MIAQVPTISVRRTPPAGTLIACLCGVLLVAGCTSREAVIARMQQNFAAQNYRAALIDLENLVRKEPRNADFRLKLAQSLLHTGNFAAAETEFSKAGELGIAQAVLLPGLAEALLREGQYQRALDDLAGPGAPAELSAPLLELRAQALLGLHREPEAREAWMLAIAKAPQDVPAHLGLAQTLVRLGDASGAKAELDAADKAAPDSFEVHIALGRWFWLQHQPQPARDQFTQAVELAQRGGSRPGTATALAELGEVDCTVGDVAACRQHLQQLQKLAPASEATLLLRGRVEAQTRQWDAATSTLKELLSRDPHSVPGNTLAGMVAAGSGHPETAESYYSEVLSQQPGNLAVRRLLAEVQLQQHQTAEALRTATDPAAGADAGLLSLAGRASLLQGDVATGLEYLERSERAAPSDKRRALEVAQAYIATNRSAEALKLLQGLEVPDSLADRREWLLLSALERAGRPAEARKAAQDFSQARSRDAAAQLIAAGTLHAVRDEDGARALIAKAAALDTHSPLPWVQLGWLEWSQRNYAAADQAFSHALQIDPKSNGGLLGKAQVELYGGHADSAIRRLEQVRAQSPQSLAPRIGLSRLYLSSGRLQQAAAVLAEAQALAPRNPEVRLLGALLAIPQGHGSEAVSTLQELTQQFPKAAPLQEDLARAYLAAGQAAEAHAAAESALRLDPQYWPALVTQISLAQSGNDSAAADRALEKLRHSAAPRPTVLEITGSVAAREGRLADALQSFTAAYSEAPNARLAVEVTLARRGLHAADPLGPLREWLRRAPNDIPARVMLAEMLQEDGEHEAATREYTTVLTHDAEQVVALNNLAVLKLDAGDAQAGLDLARRAYANSSGLPSIADTYGWALVQTGHAGDAVALLRAAYGKMPGNIEVRYHLGAALLKSGAVQEGREELKAVADSAGHSRASEDARSLLAGLDGKGKS